jgi:hypothetical protein
MFELIASLQRKMIGIWMLNLRKKKFIYHCVNNIFKAVNSSKNGLIVLWFCGGFSTVWPIVTIQILFDPAARAEIKMILPVIIVMGIISLFAFRQFLWLLRGEEHLEIDKENLTITKTGTFWVKPKVYSLALISDVRSKQEDWHRKGLHPLVSQNIQLTTELRNIFSSFSIGEIRFRHKNEQVKLFSNLTEDERNMVMAEIRKRLIKNNI